MKKSDLLYLKTRNQIYNYVKKNPGFHFRELSRKLKIPVSTLEYHLNYLKKNELLDVISDERNLRYYIKDEVGSREKKLIRFMRNKTSRHILIFLLGSLSISQQELSKELNKSNKTIEFHLKRMLKAGIIEPAPVENGLVITALEFTNGVERTPNGREVIYRFKIYYADTMANMIIKYKKSILGDKISKLLWDAMCILDIEHEKPAIYRNHKNQIELLEQLFWEVVPHPYHA